MAYGLIKRQGNLRLIFRGAGQLIKIKHVSTKDVTISQVCVEDPG